MALEVKVFREITAYQPKVLFGLTWRQAAIAPIALVVLVGVYMACYFLELEDLGVALVTLLAIPAVCLGWMRPMGIAFEHYVGYWWAHQQDRTPYVYADWNDNGVEKKERRRDSRRKRQARGVFEASH